MAELVKVYEGDQRQFEVYDYGLGVVAIRPPVSKRIPGLGGARLAEQEPLNIAIVAMESGLKGLPKAGGQYDYVRDLSRALAQRKLSDNRRHNVTVFTPNFGKRIKGGELLKGQDGRLLEFKIQFGTNSKGEPVSVPLHVRKVSTGNFTYYLLEDPEGIFFADLYKDPDSLRGLVEAVMLSQAPFVVSQVLKEARGEDLGIDVIHVNDWQAGLAPVYLKTNFRNDFPKMASVFTSHNMAYQGPFNGYLTAPYGTVAEAASKDDVIRKLLRSGVLEEGQNIFVRNGQTIIQTVPDSAEPLSRSNLLDLPHQIITSKDNGIEYYAGPEFGHKFSVMKGLSFADIVNAVSRGNLGEMMISKDEGGQAFNFEGLMNAMADQKKTRAVFNGVTVRSRFLPKDSLETVKKKKDDFKKELMEALKLAGEEKDFYVGVVSRISDQKGLDRLVEAMPALAAIRGPEGQQVRIVVLGKASTDKKKVDGKEQFVDPVGVRVEGQLKELAAAYPRNLSFINGFDNDWADRIYRGADGFAMPSKFEPAGIGQQIANRNGTLVIAPLTGGLKDFINEWGGVGFPYSNDRPVVGLVEKIAEAAQLYWTNSDEWYGRVRKAVSYKASWKYRVEKYERDVYGDAIRSVRGAPASPAGARLAEISEAIAQVRDVLEKNENFEPYQAQADELKIAVRASDTGDLRSLKALVISVDDQIDHIHFNGPNGSEILQFAQALTELRQSFEEQDRRIQALIELLGTKDPQLLHATLSSLITLFGRNAIPALITALRDPRRDVRVSALFGLMNIGFQHPQEVTEALREVSEGSDPKARELALMGIVVITAKRDKKAWEGARLSLEERAEEEIERLSVALASVNIDLDRLAKRILLDYAMGKLPLREAEQVLHSALLKSESAGATVESARRLLVITRVTLNFELNNAERSYAAAFLIGDMSEAEIARWSQLMVIASDRKDEDYRNRTLNILKTARDEYAAGARLAAENGPTGESHEYTALFNLGGVLPVAVVFNGRRLSIRGEDGKEFGGYDFPNIPNSITLGRSDENMDVSFPAERVGERAYGRISAHHATLTRDSDGNIFVIDHGSTNGVWIDEQRVKPAEPIYLMTVPQLVNATQAADQSPPPSPEVMEGFNRARTLIKDDVDRMMRDLDWDGASRVIDEAAAIFQKVSENTENVPYIEASHENLRLLELRRERIKELRNRKDQEPVFCPLEGAMRGEPLEKGAKAIGGKAVATVVLFGHDAQGTLYLRKGGVEGKYLDEPVPDVFYPTAMGPAQPGDKNPLDAVKRLAEEALGTKIPGNEFNRVLPANVYASYDEPGFFSAVELDGLTNEEWQALRSFRARAEERESERDFSQKVFFKTYGLSRRMIMYVVEPESEGRLAGYAEELRQKGIAVSAPPRRHSAKAVFTCLLTPEQIRTGQFEAVDAAALPKRIKAKPQEFSVEAFAPTVTEEFLFEDLLSDLKESVQQKSSAPEFFSAAERELAAHQPKVDRLRRIVQTGDDLYRIYKIFLQTFEEAQYDPAQIQQRFEEIAKNVSVMGRVCRHIFEVLREKPLQRLGFVTDHFSQEIVDASFAQLIEDIGKTPNEFTIHLRHLLEYVRYLARGNEDQETFLNKEEQAILDHIIKKHIKIPAPVLERRVEMIANKTLAPFARGGMNLAFKARDEGKETVIIAPGKQIGQGKEVAYTFLADHISGAERARDRASLVHLLIELAFFLAPVEIYPVINPTGQRDDLPFLLQSIGFDEERRIPNLEEEARQLIQSTDSKEIQAIEGRMLGVIDLDNDPKTHKPIQNVEQLGCMLVLMTAALNRKDTAKAWEYFDRFKERLKRTRFFRVDQQFPYGSVTLHELIDRDQKERKEKKPGVLKTWERLKIIADYSNAMADSVEAGIIHRDLKLGNIQIRLEKEGEGPQARYRVKGAMMTDYGLSIAKVGVAGIVIATIEKGFGDPEEVMKAFTPNFFPPARLVAKRYQPWMVDDTRRDPISGAVVDLLTLGLDPYTAAGAVSFTYPSGRPGKVFNFKKQADLIAEITRAESPIPADIQEFLVHPDFGIRLDFSQFPGGVAPTLEAAAAMWRAKGRAAAVLAEKYRGIEGADLPAVASRATAEETIATMLGKANATIEVPFQEIDSGEEDLEKELKELEALEASKPSAQAPAPAPELPPSGTEDPKDTGQGARLAEVHKTVGIFWANDGHVFSAVPREMTIGTLNGKDIKVALKGDVPKEFSERTFLVYEETDSLSGRKPRSFGVSLNAQGNVMTFNWDPDKVVGQNDFEGWKNFINKFMLPVMHESWTVQTLTGARLAQITPEQALALRQMVDDLNDFYANSSDETAERIIRESEQVLPELRDQALELLNNLRPVPGGQTDANQIGSILRAINRILEYFDPAPSIQYQRGREENKRFFLQNLPAEDLPAQGARLALEKSSAPAEFPARLRVPRLAKILGQLDLEGFLVGVAHAYPARILDGKRLAVGEATILKLSVVNGQVVARSDDGLTVVLDKWLLSRQRVTQEALRDSLTLSDLRVMVEAINKKVYEALAKLTFSHDKPVILEINFDIIDNGSFKFYLDYLLAELEHARKEFYGRNVFIKAAGKRRFVEAAKARAPSLFATDAALKDLKEAATVKIAPATAGLTKGVINVPVAALAEGDVPAFRALIQVCIYSGQIDVKRIPDPFASAYSTMAGAWLSTADISSILTGFADLETLLKGVIKAVVRAPIDLAVKAMDLMKRMIERAA
ncbi:MAG: glycogen/starch synthase [Candidatus Omnitrophota bacterium]